MRKPSRKTLRKKLDTLVKNIVRERDNYTCQHCGKNVIGSDCHVSHVIPVSAGLRLAYDPINMKVLCYHCHINWWHKNPLSAGEWFGRAFPERMEYLHKATADKPTPIKDWQLAELYEKLKKLK